MMTAIGHSATVRTPQQKASVVRLDHKFVAPCCYSQVLADHMSQEAVDMRNQVVAFGVAGKSEREITEYYKAKYGRSFWPRPMDLGELLRLLLRHS
jgi:cytochrome c-type biogenesis protein CcmH/NrfF